MNKCYSADGDYYSDLELVMEELNNDLEIGEETEIYEAEIQQMKHSDFVFSAHFIIKYMQENASDLLGDLTESYLEDLGDEKIIELQLLLVKWMNLYAKQPTFYKAVNPRKIPVTVGQ